MATIPCNWDNTDVNASANATGQRISKRVKSVGGAWDTTGFAPANDLAKTDNNAVATILPNNVYEFMVEALCAVGGPTINNNGIQEGTVFACIAPSFTPGETNVEVSINVSTGSITKARIVLKKQSDNSTVDDQTVNRVGGFITYDFTGLTSSEAYYVEIEYYDTVNGVEVVSSSAEYLGGVCGGNTAGYQVETTGGGAGLSFINETASSTMDGTTGFVWYFCPIGFPIAAGDSEDCTHGGYSGSLNVTATISGGDCRVEIYVNGALYQCHGQIGTGFQTYTFASVTFLATDDVEIKLVGGDVCP